ncbi:MAG: NADH-quinone oxidoreductase subunit D [Bacteriovoracaceae bacterium]|nr:NADH-quinone oxidoreductase subunit D [Bacteriovoracaceae bacterium]
MSSNISNVLKKYANDSEYVKEGNTHVISCQLNKFDFFINLIKKELDFILLIDICVVDNLKRNNKNNSNKRFEVIYQFLNMELFERLRLKLSISEEEYIPSVKKYWLNAQWCEREAKEMFGIAFEDSSYQNLLLVKDDISFPLRKDRNYQTATFSQIDKLRKDRSSENTLLSKYQLARNSHHVTGLSEIEIQERNEQVLKVQTEIGLYHRGLEKNMESISYTQSINLVDRLNYYSAPINSSGWCKAVEDLLNIEIPERAKGIRMIFCELSRISDHLNCLGTMASTVADTNYYFFSIELREMILELVEKALGSRLGFGFARIGGVATDLPSGWISSCMDLLKTLKQAMDSYSKILVKNEIWMRENQIGGISAYDAINWGYTGPCLRAAGVNYDMRKNIPYYFYDQVDFDVIVGTTGNCYDRFLVRIEEIKQSIKIVSQVLDNLPPGECRVVDLNNDLKSKNPNAVAEFCQLLNQGMKPVSNEVYSSIESPNGELGFFIVADGGKHPYRVKIKAPSFCTMQSFPKLVRYNNVDQIKPILSSLNIVMNEIDR